jgi:hypothetical protein
MRYHGMELRKLRLKLFVHQQKCLQRAANIAIASGHDFVDGGLMYSGTHRKASKYSPHDNCFLIHGLLWIMWKDQGSRMLDDAVPRWKTSISRCPLVSAFVNEAAATRRRCRNWGTGKAKKYRVCL